MLEPVHDVTVVEVPNNFAAYRWVATCTCAWQGRGPSEEVANSMASTHGHLVPKTAGAEAPPAQEAQPPAGTSATGVDTTVTVSKSATVPPKKSPKDTST